MELLISEFYMNMKQKVVFYIQYKLFKCHVFL